MTRSKNRSRRNPDDARADKGTENDTTETGAIAWRVEVVPL